jgi:hypothetical protein
MSYLVWVALGLFGYAGAQFVLKPIWDFRTARDEVAHALAEFGSVDAADNPRIQKARVSYRELASTLKARAHAIPDYALWSSLQIVPTVAEIEKACANLIGLSNTVGLQREREENIMLRRNVETALRLKVTT